MRGWLTAICCLGGRCVLKRQRSSLAACEGDHGCQHFGVCCVFWLALLALSAVLLDGLPIQAACRGDRVL